MVNQTQTQGAGWEQPKVADQPSKPNVDFSDTKEKVYQPVPGPINPGEYNPNDPHIAKHGRDQMNPQIPDQTQSDEQKEKLANQADKEPGLHPVTVPADVVRNSGRHINRVGGGGLISVHPSTGSTANHGDDDYQTFGDFASLFDYDKDEFAYPYHDLEVGGGLFIPVKAGNTIDNLMADVYKEVDKLRKKYAVIELDERGDEIWDQVTVKTKKRNGDGSIMMKNGKPIEGANFTHKPMYNYIRDFVVKAVTKDTEFSEGSNASSDGVVVVRVA